MVFKFFKRFRKSRKEPVPAAELRKKKERELVRILSVDGGGIRGIIPAMILTEIEKITGESISSLFDIMAGCSTGALIILSLTMPGEGGKPRYRAEEMIELYENEGENIFSRSFTYKLKSLGSIKNQKYPSEGLEKVLKHYFGDTMLSDAVKTVIIPSYDIERRQPFFFKSRYAGDESKEKGDFPMRIVARATSAAPMFFDPAKINIGGSKDYYALIDGGVVANNPAMCAYAEARSMYPEKKRRDFFMLSLGTGSASRRIPYEEARGWGVAGWAKPLLSAVYDGASKSVDYQLKQLFSEGNYFRVQAKLDEKNDDLDDASPGNIRDLKILAENFIREHRETIKRICSILTGNIIS